MPTPPQHLAIGDRTGATLRALRQRSRRTQGQMAQLLHVTERQYQRWEADHTDMPLAHWELLLRVWGARHPIDFEIVTRSTRGWDTVRDTQRDTIARGDVVELQPIVGPMLRATVSTDLPAAGGADDAVYAAHVTEFVGVDDAGEQYDGFRIGERVSFVRANVIHLEQRAPRAPMPATGA